MDVKIVLAACLPVALLFLLSVVLISITCTVMGYKRKKAELHFKIKVAKEPRKVIEVLSKTVPKSMYPQFLSFAEKIMSGTCEDCQNFQGTVKGKEEEGEDEFDGVIPEEGVYGDEAMLIMQAQNRDVSSRMLSSMAKIIQSGLDNPKISGHLCSTMMAMLAARGVLGAGRPGAVVGGAVNPMAVTGIMPPAVSSPHDPGYSGSNSNSTHSESIV